MRREFPLADILTLTTGWLLSKEGPGPLYQLLNFLTREEIFTHQIPRAAKVCRPWVLAQHPDLPHRERLDGLTEENWREWLAAREEEFGAVLPLEALPGDDWEHVDPILEAERMWGPGRVLVVTP